MWLDKNVDCTPLAAKVLPTVASSGELSKYKLTFALEYNGENNENKHKFGGLVLTALGIAQKENYKLKF